MKVQRTFDSKAENKNGETAMDTLRTTYVIDEQGVIVAAIGKVDTRNHTAQILWRLMPFSPLPARTNGEEGRRHDRAAPAAPSPNGGCQPNVCIFICV